MNLSDLRYALAVAQEKHFRKAAQRCFISQPALSLSIQRLEGELGVKLFERNRKEVTVTPAGLLVLEQAQRTLEEADKIKLVAQQHHNPLAGVLKLGVIFTIGPYLLPDLIPLLHEKAPLMALDVEENTTANLAELLKNGKIDIAIIALPFVLPNIETRALYDEPFAVVTPKNHPLANQKTIDPHTLNNEKVLLLASGHCFSNQVLEACPQLHQHSSDVLQGNSLETVRHMVASGLGITVLPQSALVDRYKNPLLKIIPFSEPAPSRRVAIAWRKSYARTQAIDALMSAIASLPTRCLKKLT
jgi:LysR family hydrogen peroxide-inducible transcriptional activator